MEQASVGQAKDGRSNASEGQGARAKRGLVAEIANVLQTYRKEKLHLSLRHFAQELGVSRRALRTLEQGNSWRCSMGVVDKVLARMGIDFWEFVAKPSYRGKGHMSQGNLNGEFVIQYSGEGLTIVSLTFRHPSFFFGLFQLEAKRAVHQAQLPQADLVVFQGFRGRLVLRYQDQEYLLSEDRHFTFERPALPSEIYNSDQIREATCFLLTVPSFL